MSNPVGGAGGGQLSPQEMKGLDQLGDSVSNTTDQMNKGVEQQQEATANQVDKGDPTTRAQAASGSDEGQAGAGEGVSTAADATAGNIPGATHNQ